MSTLSLAALEVAKGELDAGVHGGDPVRFASPRIFQYLHAVGVHSPSPWCAAAVYFCFDEARFKLGAYPVPPNPCPKTASALHLWDESPLRSRTQLPAPGDVFVLDKGKGHGHVGFVLSASPDGQTICSVEPDTNGAGSTTGDAWGQHLWRPRDGARGKLLGYLEFAAGLALTS